MTKKKRRVYKKKRYTFPIILLLLLVAARLYLPVWTKNYINKVLADIPGYYGQVDKINISLYRGAYQIHGMYLNKVDAETQVPFLSFPKSDVSIEWKSLLKGRIVSEIIMTSPKVIYVAEDQQKTPTEGDPNIDDWTKALTDIVPLEINHFEVHDGGFAYVEVNTDPNIDLQISKITLTADNLRNVVAKERVLPSPIKATGVSIGNGTVSLDGAMNIVKEIPDMNINFSLENANVTALNPFTRHYTGIDFESGTFGLFSEIAIADGHLKGYLKPLLTKTKLIGSEDGFLGVLWEGFVSFFKFILKNQGTNTLATRVPIEGDLNNVEAGVWPTVISIFENAWIRAFSEKVDNVIDFEDAFNDPNLSKEEKKELRKKRREQRRAEREKDTTGFLKNLFDGTKEEDKEEN
ncbi:DUF748 domain-containing protein [Ulvibacter litoralis]|uniref:DUF748 domain-containing protein n=1 Tax=Ulvibacter litoralis TaxID=227084 RepID=A0A1G7EK80_9FLAO|nr:DUF748 domain-containing protein [Ulvibacter litoralis]GHC54735.1 hypothetical protein GCM10008083_18810 [Ulvibacter litoralis]SDE64100.1 protein of unknown function [Ulvibacter litoralis]